MQKSELIHEVIRVLKLEAQGILDCAQRLKAPSAAASFERALEYLRLALENKGKIVMTGVGKSGKVAQKIAATLSSTGSLAVFLHPTEGLHGDLGLVRPEDVVIALSYTGNTEELIQLIPSLKKRQVVLIGIGGNSKSKLAEQCDVWLDARVETEACPHNLAPTTSTTLALALGDALAVALMQLRRFDSGAFALNHPGGSIGKKLNLRVSDLMHHGEAVPILGPLSSMEEVIIESTKKKLGAVLIVKESRLLGIITDGDLRRALRSKEKFFEFRAEEVMTPTPIVATPEMFAQTALELMENRVSQISVLPVIDPEGNWKGLLRLHDLIRAF